MDAGTRTHRLPSVPVEALVRAALEAEASRIMRAHQNLRERWNPQTNRFDVPPAGDPILMAYYGPEEDVGRQAQEANELLAHVEQHIRQRAAYRVLARLYAGEKWGDLTPEEQRLLRGLGWVNEQGDLRPEAPTAEEVAQAPGLLTKKELRALMNAIQKLSIPQRQDVARVVSALQSWYARQDRPTAIVPDIPEYGADIAPIARRIIALDPITLDALATFIERILPQIPSGDPEEGKKHRGGGWLEIYRVPCGKQCRGCPHGPYARWVTRTPEGKKRVYLGRVLAY